MWREIQFKMMIMKKTKKLCLNLREKLRNIPNPKALSILNWWSFPLHLWSEDFEE